MDSVGAFFGRVFKTLNELFFKEGIRTFLNACTVYDKNIQN